ncbi:MAG: MaoC family dehydratase [Paracoccaceae bacterium]
MALAGKRSLDELRALLGKEIGVSKWITVDQTMIDQFAKVTDDHQYIHIDPVKAAGTPFGGTIAHGFLTLSLLSAMVYEAGPAIKGVTMGVNYGFDKIRFLNPVRAGKRVRGRFVLAKLDESVPGQITYKQDVSVEIEGEEKPALIAEWIGRVYMGKA